MSKKGFIENIIWNYERGLHLVTWCNGVEKLLSSVQISRLSLGNLRREK